MVKKKACLIILKMAQADGRLAEEERRELEFFRQELKLPETLEILLEEADDSSLEELVGSLEKYPDRFFIALRACAMAHVDFHFHTSEKELYDELLQLLGISTEDMKLIEDICNEDVDEAPERLERYYRESSFC